MRASCKAIIFSLLSVVEDRPIFCQTHTFLKRVISENIFMKLCEVKDPYTDGTQSFVLHFIYKISLTDVWIKIIVKKIILFDRK